MNTTSDGGNQHERGLRGDPGADRGEGDGTRDQMCNTISELEAARDHLRARLCALVDMWQHETAVKDTVHATMGIGWKACAADLLAVLTEPQHEKKENTDNNLARVDTMGEGADSRTASEDVAGSVGPMTPDQERHQPKGR